MCRLTCANPTPVYPRLCESRGCLLEQDRSYRSEHLDHDGTQSRSASRPPHPMRALPRSRGRLHYSHFSVRSYVTLAETHNARINAFVHLGNDPKPSQISPHGPLSGMTVAVKDNICTSDMPTMCSSLMLKGSLTIPSLFLTGPDFRPDFFSPYDATVVQLLRTSGAQIVGKTNCDEFGMGCAV